MVPERECADCLVLHNITLNQCVPIPEDNDDEDNDDVDRDHDSDDEDVLNITGKVARANIVLYIVISTTFCIKVYFGVKRSLH